MNENRFIQNLYLINRAFLGPLEAFYTLLIFILNKEIGLSPFQLSVLACAKPCVSLIAFHSSAWTVGKAERIRPYLITACLLGAIPALFFPAMHNGWLFIASYALFMASLRASSPAWIEILKRNTKENSLGSIVAKGSSINYFLVIFIPLGLSAWLDQDPKIWKWLFSFLGGLQIGNVFVLLLLRIKSGNAAIEKPPVGLIYTWKEGLKLLKNNRFFAKYQLLFFLGGIGLVALQPMLPIYFKETLGLSYTQLTLAFSLCKGLSFVISAPFWAKVSRHISIYALNSIVNIFSILFITFILVAAGGMHWLLLAYLMYGTMQAGCEMSWYLSGPYYSQEKESTFYSGVNHAFVGIRGCLSPFIGQLFYALGGVEGVFLFAGAVTVIALFYAIFLGYRENNEKGPLHLSTPYSSYSSL